MAFDDVTDPKAVRAALAEYRAIGQDLFLEKYGFGAARGWLLRDGNGEEYDAKAILGAAHGYQHPNLGPLPHTEFYGGEPTARRLRQMGFTVAEPTTTRRNPVWSRDELILALDLYMRHRPAFPGDQHPDVIALSQFLNQLGAAFAAGSEKFRNPNGVAMKLQNFRRLDPDERGKGLSGGGKGEIDVWNAFAKNLIRLQETAEAIKAAVPIIEDSGGSEPDEGEEAEEGRVLTRLHRFRERDRGIIERRKAKALRENGRLACEACQFDFLGRYGERGSGFIECHHTRPVSELKAGEKTRLEDLSLLCANCHRIVHVRRPWLSLADLKDLLTTPFRSPGALQPGQ